MKKFFTLSIEHLAVLKDMNFEQKGQLFDAIYNYQQGIEIPLDFGIKMAFAPIRQHFIDDAEKQAQFVAKQKQNGAKGGRPAKIEVKEKQIEPTELPIVKMPRKIETTNNIEERKSAFKELLKEFMPGYEIEMLKEFFEYWTEPNKSGRKMRFEDQKFFDLKRRLATWHRNNKNKYPNKTTTYAANDIKTATSTDLEKYKKRI